MKGKIRKYLSYRGYGFIKGEDGKYAFVHKTDIPFWTIFLNVGDKVEYLPENTIRGMKATKLRIL